MRIEVLNFTEVSSSPERVRYWDACVRDRRSNLYAMYHSREWLSCFQDASASQPLLVELARDGSSRTLAALAHESVGLKFQASRRFQFSFQLQCLEVLGGELMGDADYDAYCELTRFVWQTYPQIQAIYFKSVTNDSPLWKMLDERGWQIGAIAAYKPDATRTFHYLELAPSFDEYLGGFRKKQRYNLKRQVRVLSEAHDNSLELQSITLESDVPALIESVHQIAQNSWKATALREAVPHVVQDSDLLRRIAAGGLLRAYVLKVRGQPCAYAIGYLFNGIYHYANIGYDDALAQYSPGNVLLLLVIQDLIEQAGARLVNFGVTDAEYKRILGNRHIEDAGLLLLRPNLGNSMKRSMHALFRNAKQAAKSVLGSRAPVRKNEED